MVRKQNGTCKRLRKSLGRNVTDLLVVVFDGVIGSFIHSTAFEYNMTGYEQLYIRPGTPEALAELAQIFKIAILLNS